MAVGRPELRRFRLALLDHFAPVREADDTAWMYLDRVEFTDALHPARREGESRVNWIYGIAFRAPDSRSKLTNRLGQVAGFPSAEHFSCSVEQIPRGEA